MTKVSYICWTIRSTYKQKELCLHNFTCCSWKLLSIKYIALQRALVYFDVHRSSISAAIGCRPSGKSSSPFELQFGQDFMDPNRKGLDLWGPLQADSAAQSNKKQDHGHHSKAICVLFNFLISSWMTLAFHPLHLKYLGIARRPICNLGKWSIYFCQQNRN